MLIGFMAPAGSGKSKASKHLARAYGFARVHVGKPVKDAMRRGFGLSKDAVDGDGKDVPNIKLGGATPRSVMEPFSEAVHRSAPNATANAVRPRIARALAKGRDVVVDGVRAQKEADLIRRLGGKIVSIDTGRSPDPGKPMDLRQAEIVADHVLRAEPKKKAIRAAVDGLMTKLMAAE